MPTEFSIGELEVTAEDMAGLADVVLKSSKARIRRAVDEFDIPMRALSASYRSRKVKAGRRPVRDFVMSGVTIGTLRRISATPQESVVAFTQPEGERRMLIRQNLGDRAFGISPTDARAADQYINELLDRVARRLFTPTRRVVLG